MCARICFAVIFTSFPDLGSAKVFTVDFPVVPLYASTRLIVSAQAFTGQRIPLSTRCWVTVSIFSPFFCSTNVMETHSAIARHVSGRSCWSSRIAPSVDPLKKRTSSQVMMLVFRFPSSLLVVEYSQDLMAKKSPPKRSPPWAVVSSDDLSS